MSWIRNSDLEAAPLLADPRAVTLGTALALAALIVPLGCGDGANTAPTTTLAPHRHTNRLPPNGVRVQWKKEALRPATRPGRICITTLETGHFCASYRIGQTPATALKIRLLEHGYIPVTVRAQQRP